MVPFRQSGFSVVTANRVYTFITDQNDEVHNWVDGKKSFLLDIGTCLCFSLQ